MEMSIEDDGLFHVLFVTTPARLETPRFGAYFARARLPGLALKFVLKRREPKAARDEQGRPLMSWTPSCSEEDFEKGAQALVGSGRDAWINIEGILRPLDEALLARHASLGALVSGHELTPQAALETLERLPAGARKILALENEAMLLAGAKLMERVALDGLVIGASYLSESSKVYDQMGLERYRLLMRGLGKRAAALGSRPYTTSNYCTFEASGVGDKNKDFVAEQVDFVSKQGAWGSLTRFYSHLDVAQLSRETMGKGGFS
jgi:hypothetical protein